MEAPVRRFRTPEDELRAAWWAFKARIVNAWGSVQPLGKDADAIYRAATERVTVTAEIPKCYWCAKPHYPHPDDCPQMMGDLRMRQHTHLWE